MSLTLVRSHIYKTLPRNIKQFCCFKLSQQQQHQQQKLDIKELFKTFECVKVRHWEDLPIGFTPFKISKPSGWVRHNLTFSWRASQEEAKLIRVHFIIASQDVDCNLEREHQFVSFNQTSANVFVEVQSEMII